MTGATVRLGYRPKTDSEKIGKQPDDEVLVACDPRSNAAFQRTVVFLLEEDNDKDKSESGQKK